MLADLDDLWELGGMYLQNGLGENGCMLAAQYQLLSLVPVLPVAKRQKLVVNREVISFLAWLKVGVVCSRERPEPRHDVAKCCLALLVELLHLL